jgi:Flp pilus assembly protein TadG
MHPGTSRRKHAARLGALKRRLLNEEGSELVESAISILLLFMLILGVIEGCWAFYGLHYVASVTHEAARYAIVRGGSWAQSCDGSGTAGSGYSSSMCTASPADIENYVANRNYPGLNITAGDVCVEYFTSVPSSASTSCTASTGSILSDSPGDIVQVTVTYPFSFSLPTPVPPFKTTFNWQLASTSQMVIAQ